MKLPLLLMADVRRAGRRWPTMPIRATKRKKDATRLPPLDDPQSRQGGRSPQEMIAAMNIKPGMTVADIGTGTGYMLKFLSDAVGPTGRCIGEDIQTDFLDRARAKSRCHKCQR